MANGIFVKMAALQQEIAVKKGNYNEFGDFDYRSLEDITAALKPLTKKLKLFFFAEVKPIPLPVDDKYALEATVHFIDTEDGSEFTTSYAAEVPEKKSKLDASQLSGSAGSYATKYAYSAALGLSEQDPDELPNDDSGEEEEDEEPKKNPKRLKKKLLALCDEHEVDACDILKKFGWKDRTDASVEQVEKAIRYLEEEE